VFFCLSRAGNFLLRTITNINIESDSHNYENGILKEINGLQPDLEESYIDFANCLAKLFANEKRESLQKGLRGIIAAAVLFRLFIGRFERWHTTDAPST